MIRRCAVSVLALGMAGTLVACTSSGGGGKTPTPTPTSSGKSSSGSSSPTSKAPSFDQPTKLPTSVHNKPGVISKGLVKVTSCKSVTGGWSAEGSAKTPDGKAATYTITVFFTSNPGATVESFGTKNVKIPAGGTGNWSITEKFRASKSVLCTLRGAGPA